MMKKHIAAGGLVLASSLSQAGMISDYALDATTNIVTNSATGLQWLQWDETIGRSIDWFNNDIGAQALRDAGWEVATNTQLGGLFNDFGFGGITWDTNENTSQLGDASAADAITFMSVFGDTVYGPSGGPPNTYGHARAFFGVDADTDGLINMASVADNISGGSTGFVFLDRDFNSVTYSHSRTGIALTRTAQVPEPPMLALLSLGLAGLMWRRALN